MGKLKVFSGKCCLCDVGVPTGHQDVSGRDLHTGDIVLVYSGRYVGTDLEEWAPSGGLTVVVSGQYTSFGDGSVDLNQKYSPFVMGIKDCGFSHPEWQIHLVKHFDDVVEGEHWREFGFSYQYSDEADSAIAKALKTDTTER